MRIRSLWLMWKKTRYIGGILKKYSDVLAPGRYHIYNSFLAMSLQHPKIRAAADPLFCMVRPLRLGTKMSGILNKISYFKNRSKRSSGEYEALYIANNADIEREIKLFSFEKRQVLYICKDLRTMNKQLEEYQMLKSAYPMPRVAKNDRYATALDVDLIQSKPSPGDGFALTAIARATAAYNSEPAGLSRRTTGALTDFSYDDERMNELLKNLRDRIDPRLLDEELPLCMQHGDLSKENLLYGEISGVDDYWFIDWEHRGERIFFFDYFFYILNPAFYGELGGLHCYLSGENDESLKTFFAHFGWSFHPDKRQDYFLIYAICFLKERVCDLGNFSTLQQYCDIIDRYCHESIGNGGTV